MRVIAQFLIGLSLCSALWGCNADDRTGIPQPFPLPKEQSIRASGLYPDANPQEVRVVGLPDTVPSAGTIALSNGNQTVETRSTAAGTFTAKILAHAGDVLEVRFETSEPAKVTVAELAVMVRPPPGPQDGVPPVTGPTDGVVIVQGQSSASVPVFVVDLDTGAVGSGASDGQGRFSLSVAAAPGHLLQVYEDNQPLGAAWELTVP